MIQVAKDRRTGFPCVRREPGTDWVALLPVTKLQVEQWIWEGGLDSAEDAGDVTALIERLELTPLPSEYPPAVQQLARRPISQCGPADLPSLVASHLSLWESPEEVRRADVTFPTPHSEWGRVCRWLRGRVPAAREWRLTLDFYGRFRSRDLVQGILGLDLEWPPAVAALLEQLHGALPESETGLPLMRLGLYELIADKKLSKRLAASPPESLYRPFVAGESRIWPSLDPPGANRWRPVLQQFLPILAIRLWYPEDAVEGSTSDPALSFSSLERNSLHAGATSIGAHRRSSQHPEGYRSSRATMKNRCPVCYSEVDSAVFHSPEPLWCCEKADGKYQHGNKVPDGSQAMIALEAIHQDYLRVVRAEPAQVRSVTLSGFTKTGKGTWLLSLAGLMYYPSGKPRLRDGFPAAWNFTRLLCSTAHLVHQETSRNLQIQMEDLWINGDVPPRTDPQQKALRSPFLFGLDVKGPLGISKRRELVLIFNDMSGERIINTAEMAKDPKLAHLASTTDLLFLIPACEVFHQERYLEVFTGALGALSFEGRALNPGTFNLILGLSQIDKLKNGSQQERDLLSIFLKEPYLLPDNNPGPEETRAYFATMVEVHDELGSWLKTKVPDVVTAAERFASVRYCGFSALGCEVIQRSNKQGSESCLPFEPQPLRIVDPVFWLLLENGLVKL